MTKRRTTTQGKPAEETGFLGGNSSSSEENRRGSSDFRFLSCDQPRQNLPPVLTIGRFLNWPNSVSPIVFFVVLVPPRRGHDVSAVPVERPNDQRTIPVGNPPGRRLRSAVKSAFVRAFAERSASGVSASKQPSFGPMLSVMPSLLVGERNPLLPRQCSAVRHRFPQISVRRHTASQDAVPCEKAAPKDGPFRSVGSTYQPKRI